MTKDGRNIYTLKLALREEKEESSVPARLAYLRNLTSTLLLKALGLRTLSHAINTTFSGLTMSFARTKQTCASNPGSARLVHDEQFGFSFSQYSSCSPSVDKGICGD